MPNWVSNSLEISGPAEEIKRFQKEAQGNGQLISLEKLYPCPPELRDTQATPGLTLENLGDDKSSIANYYKREANLKKYGFSDWWEWCVKRWGCKWDLGSGEDSVYLDLEDCTRVIYVFDTAWDPPRAAFSKISEMFPELEFKLCFQEGSMGFEGTFTCKNGEVSMDDTHDYTPEFEGEEDFVSMSAQVK